MKMRKKRKWFPFKPEEAVMIGLMILSLMGLAYVLLTTGCSSIQPWSGAPYGQPFKEVEAVRPLPPVEGDSRLVTVPVGQLRYSLLVAEEYDALVPYVNEQFGFANQIAERYDALLKHDRLIYANMKARQYVGAGIGIGLGIILGAGVSLLISR